MASLRDWLQLFRAHTWPATLIFVFSLYVVGGGQLTDIRFPLAILASLMFHWFGFGHNSVMDFTAGYDKYDPHKQHFPLVAGRIRLSAAHNLIHTAMIISSIYILIITLELAANPTLALAGFALALTFGHAYNDGLGKTTSLKFLPLALYTIAMASWAYFFVAPAPTRLYWITLFYVFLVGVYEIAYEGELKEIKFPGEANLLRKLGARVVVQAELEIFVPTTCTRALSYSLFAAKCFVIFWLTLVAGISPLYLHVLATFVLMVFAGHKTKEITERRYYNHDKDLTNMALVEVFSAFALITAIAPLCGWLAAIAVILFSMGYFAGMNRFLWRTVVRPQV